MPEIFIDQADCELKLEAKQVQVFYKVQFENAFYDICNFEGRILFTGKIPLNSELIVDMSACFEGYYNLFILDGTTLIKRTFFLGSGLSFQ